MLARSDPPAGARADGLGPARLLATLLPAALLAGAYAFQYLGGLPPCEMCWWQRYGHFAALLFAVPALFVRGTAARGVLTLAALAILASGLIGAYHAGVEAGVFPGVTQCTSTMISGTGADALAQIMATPLVRCDVVPWSLFGVSMAGWNAILSITGALVIAWLTLKPIRTRR